jgi:hypothetical protein
MRRIIKGQEPEELRSWKEQNAVAPQNLTYSNMPKAGVKLQMLAEQGHLCAYTMQRIQTVQDCHIEHVVPQSQPNQPPHLDIDYSNLLACVPSDTPGHRPISDFPYGARKKGERVLIRTRLFRPFTRMLRAGSSTVRTDPSGSSLATTLRKTQLGCLHWIMASWPTFVRLPWKSAFWMLVYRQTKLGLFPRQ